MSLSYPDDRRYHPEHLWAQSRSDGSALVGISDYAQDQLGAVIFVELPETGAHFTQGQSCASIESAKVTSDAVMPLSGTVLEIKFFFHKKNCVSKVNTLFLADTV